MLQKAMLVQERKSECCIKFQDDLDKKLGFLAFKLYGLGGKPHGA